MLRIIAALGIVAALIIAISAEQEAGAHEQHTALPVSPPAAPNSLLDQIKAADARLFDAVFKNCDAAALKTMLAEDFEFYHDRGGLIATNSVQFIARIEETCARQSSGQEARSRRELVESSLEVFPLSHYGAIETGLHRFFILKDGEPEKAGDIAKFTHVWKKEGAEWRLARVLSFDHQPQ